MAQTKTDYGLIYNDDGSICTTVRPDQIPFVGVNSFAVETATTNLLGNAFDTAIFTDIAMGPGTILNHLPGKGLYGSMLTRATKSDNMTQSYVSAARIIRTFFIPQVGETYTYSVYARLYGKQSNQPFYLSYYDGKKGFSINVGLLTPEWKRYSYTFTVRPEYTGGDFVLYNMLRHSSVEVGNGFEICLPQVEQKPFASSFVDGSRPTGVIAVPFYIDLNTEDWVVSFWHKMTNTYSFASRIIFSIDGNFHLNTYHPSAGKYNWMCMNTDNVVFKASSTTTVDTNWNFIVLTKNGSNFKVYINGIPEINLNYTGTLKYNVNNFKFGNFKIGELDYVSHSLFSNIYIGKYRRKDGTVIWTDDYIREVYEAKMPFAVQSLLFSIY